MIYLIGDISTIYCALSVYQTLFVSNPFGAIGSDVCFRACPVSRWSLSINISSQESIWYLGGLPWFCARLDTFNSVPAAPNSAVTRPKGIRASQGTGMLMTSRIVFSQLLLRSWSTPYLALFGCTSMSTSTTPRRKTTRQEIRLQIHLFLIQAILFYQHSRP